METNFHIKVDSFVLHEAEEYASSINKPLSEIVSDFLVAISIKKNRNDISSKVNSYEELVSALEESRQAIKNGRIVNENVVRKRIKECAGLSDV